jgi:hypothetical protein
MTRNYRTSHAFVSKSVAIERAEGMYVRNTPPHASTSIIQHLRLNGRVGWAKYCAVLFMPGLFFCFFQERKNEQESGAHQRFHSVGFLENVRGVGRNNPLSRQLLHENHS